MLSIISSCFLLLRKSLKKTPPRSLSDDPLRFCCWPRLQCVQRGAVTQSFNFTQANGWSTQDREYDAMGCPYRTGNPYYSAGYGSIRINPTGLWTTRTIDNLGCVTKSRHAERRCAEPNSGFLWTE